MNPKDWRLRFRSLIDPGKLTKESDGVYTAHRKLPLRDVESFIAQEIKLALESLQLKQYYTACNTYEEAIADLESAKQSLLREMGL